jgi:hypothetical protein
MSLGDTNLHILFMFAITPPLEDNFLIPLSFY